ncbi:hypothetical protein [Methylopila sp. Yamaguchi]|uniref:hypothetical protein n=1 Tax=Methylopila sp. Yamaguchi TaxID=1437817 RepID=UPI000CC1A8B1|nr:hypothetical protein [Methylopila sp. Yamaguchi]GBD48534.1 hypothetical protein METY_1747 [Methylopila sp. Yamaguchi]
MILTHADVTQPVEEWALDYGITPELIEHRMARGWTTAAAIETPMDAPKGWRLPKLVASAPDEKPARHGNSSIIVEHDGRALSLREWSARLGIAHATLYARHRRGMSADRIVAPSAGRGGYRHGRRAGGGKQFFSNAAETGAPVTRKIAPK